MGSCAAPRRTVVRLLWPVIVIGLFLSPSGTAFCPKPPLARLSSVRGFVSVPTTKGLHLNKRSKKSGTKPAMCDPWLMHDPWEWQMEQNRTSQPWPGFDSGPRQQERFAVASVRRAIEQTDDTIIQEWERVRQDECADEEFYSSPRLVYHADHDCLDRLTSLYRELIRPGSCVLDLMSSWTSHLPLDVQYSRVIGIGMNEAELQSNPILSSCAVQDLNADPVLPQATDSVDAVLLCSGIEYLTHPEAVLAEAMRVLREDGVAIVSMGDIAFPSKATKAFSLRPAPARTELMAELLRGAGMSGVRVHEEVREPTWVGADRLFAVSGLKPRGARARGAVGAAHSAQRLKTQTPSPAQRRGGRAMEGEGGAGCLEVGGRGGRGIVEEAVEVLEGSPVVWAGRFGKLVEEAEGMGIPREQMVPSALEGGASAEEYRRGMQAIQQIIASRLSSNL